MSADLFAQFGPFSGGNGQQNQQNQSQGQAPAGPAAQQADDPFAFLSTAFSQPSSSPVPQQQTPTPSSQSQTPQPQQWSFGAPQQPAQPAQPALNWGTGGGGNAWSTTPAAPAAPAAEDDEDDDTWGDFEDASTSTPAQPPPMAAPPAYQASQPTPPPPSQPQAPTRTRVVRASTMDLISNTLINFGDAPANTSSLSPVPEPSPKVPQRDPWRNPVPVSEPGPAPAPAPKPKKPADPNVLFDADDFDVNESFDTDEDDDDDDEFGDFETGHTSPPRQTMATSSQFSSFPPASAPSRAPVAKPASTPAAATALVDLLSLDEPEPAGFTSSFPMSQPQETPAKGRPAANLLSPLSFGSTSMTAQSGSQAPKSPSFQERNPFPGLAVTTPVSGDFPSDRVKNRTPSPVTTWPSFDDAPAAASKAAFKDLPPPDDANWDAWGVDNSVPSQPAPVQTKKAASPKKVQTKPAAKKPAPVAKPAAQEASDWNWEAEEPSEGPGTTNLPPAIANAAAPNTISDKAPPPTNVPPPSVLLSLFPTLMAIPDEALFKPTAAQPVEVRNRVIGDPKTIAFLRNYLQIIVVAGRVVAGRKQRWHRDKFLSQSMSISAAGSSKGGGMKLAGLDKAQGQREDREAADVVAAWLRHVGKLRSAVATANAALVAAEAAEHKHYPPLKIPELQSATIPVTVAKKVPTATKPCVICGLRRDERVRGIDGDEVDDIFSEWWVEHWGHRACRNFWAEHEAALRSR